MALDTAILKKIGQRIREARTRSKLSQKQLAQKAGLSTIYIGLLERGQRQPPIDTMINLANCLGTSTLDLLLNLEDKLDRERVKEQIKRLTDLL